jgi:hypothetical protein
MRHAPDFFARLEDGTAIVVDVRADDRVGPKDAAVFARTARVCASVGWGYRRVGRLDPVLAAALRQVFAQPAALLEGVLAVGDPIAVLPVLFHLLWRRWLVTDLTGARLGPRSLVQAAGSPG